ncbi:MAG: undecaprenyl/decaprenyl-phosphate alpha-N-acetylglucosaminyl 1-phosphate transferase [Deltaproteobacteria bacterium]|nr:undecaprenyl/decaprenyl-phosphate alpha-N-acetylglucosaminyl 1-phosphate transferase [Deltaproteobacteria bacterium]
MSTFALVLLLPWAVALAVTPIVIWLATRYDLLDHPTSRKAHTQPTPLLGGVAVLVASVVGLGVALPFIEPLGWGFEGIDSLLVLGGGALAMGALGLYDDLYDVRAGSKAGIQIAIAAATWWLGFRLGSVQLPFGFVMLDASVISLLLTVGWIVLVTNAFNLIDGMDGLTTGVGVITALTVYWLAAEFRQTGAVLGALALSGALAGFLRYNLPPARIFLGDCGAYAIGYTISVLAIASYQRSSTAMLIVVPLLAAGVPMLDTLLVSVRRLFWHLRHGGVRGLHPGQVVRAVMRADRGHIHHLLLRQGFDSRRALAVLYALSGGLALLALATRHASANVRWGLLVALLVTGFAAQRWLERRAEARERIPESAENPGHRAPG